MKNLEIKGKMINEIIGAAKNAAFLANKPFDGADLFFTLAFRTNKELKAICKSLKINSQKFRKFFCEPPRL